MPVDTRSLAACAERSLRAARCLPAAEFLFPDGRLASFRGILWLLGTAGLDGRETVIVFGDSPTDRQFVAGVLLLSGQAQVFLWNASPEALFTSRPEEIGPGHRRGVIRDPVYIAWMREAMLVLRHDLIARIRSDSAPLIVDGRAGDPQQRIRGAIRYDPESWRRRAGESGEVIAYAESPRESIAFFTHLQSRGVDAKVYADGWRDWPHDEPRLNEPRDRAGRHSVYLGAVLVVIALLLALLAARVGTRR